MEERNIGPRLSWSGSNYDDEKVTRVAQSDETRLVVVECDEEQNREL